MKKRCLKKSKVFAFAAMATLAVISISSIASNTGVKPENTCESGKCGVTDEQVVSYLESNGYSNIYLVSIPGGCDKMADTDYSYDTRVFCTETSVIGHEDIPN